MIEVLEHVINDEKTMGEISRVLKPEGKLIITAPNKLFPFETQGFRLRSRDYSSKGFGFPFLPYLPEILRRHITNARVYTPWHLKKMLVKNEFSIITIKFLSPSLDNLTINFPKMRRFVNQMQKLLNHIEAFPILNTFLATIIVYAEKVKE
jgi:ubiquinone/menaquinone biosynthesis C-methylase UbiE